jgi:hypothetical protein
MLTFAEFEERELKTIKEYITLLVDLIKSFDAAKKKSYVSICDSFKQQFIKACASYKATATIKTGMSSDQKYSLFQKKAHGFVVSIMNVCEKLQGKALTTVESTITAKTSSQNRPTAVKASLVKRTALKK